jgi:hypothetical protein
MSLTSFTPASTIVVTVEGITVDARAREILPFVIAEAFVAVQSELLPRLASFRRLLLETSQALYHSTNRRPVKRILIILVL